MSLKTFGFSAVARALAATAVLGFGIASAPAVQAQTQTAYQTLVAAIAAELQNADGQDSTQIRKAIAALMSAADDSIDVVAAFNAAKAQTDAKWSSKTASTFDQRTYDAITEIGKSINYALNPATGGTGGTKGGTATINTTIGGAVAAGGHS